MRTAYVEINPKRTDPASLYKLEQILFGTDWTEPRLPLPDEIMSIMSEKHDRDWLGGIFPLFDDISYPYSGFYEIITDGYYPKIDERRF